MPAYNGERFIGAAIESVLGQTYGDFELIVVDDGSTDRTADIAGAYAARDRRITLVRQANAGPATARNVGIEHGSGRYVGFLDQDDLWLPTKLEKQVAVLDNTPARVGVVYNWIVYFDADDRLNGRYLALSDDGDVFLKLLVFLVIVPSVQLIRRAALETCGGYATDIVSAHDLDLNLRLARRFEFKVVPEFLTAFRIHEASLTNRHDLAIAEFNAIRHKVMQQGADVPPGVWKWGAASFHAYLAARMWSTARWRALRELFVAMTHDPLILASLLLDRVRRGHRLSTLPPRALTDTAPDCSAVETVGSQVAWADAHGVLPRSPYVDPIRRRRARFLEWYSWVHT